MQQNAERTDMETKLKLPLVNRERNDGGEEEEEEDEKSAEEIESLLARTEAVLCALGLDYSTRANAAFSAALFAVLGVAVPAAALCASRCTRCSHIHVFKFQMLVLVSYCALAAVSMICVAYNMNKYGLRELLFVHSVRYPVARLRRHFQSQFQATYRLFLVVVLPCLLLKTCRETWRLLFVYQDLWWKNVITLTATLVSWFYLTTVFLSGCILFNLVCNLQIVDVQHYGRLLEATSDVSLFIKEHMRLRYQLCKISHRFRIYLLLVFLVVTASQFMTLFELTDSRVAITFLNTGDILVCSVIQLVGVVLCLRAAAKTTHRAQGIAAVASQWHALATLGATGMSDLQDNYDTEITSEYAFHISSLFAAEYESDLESSNTSIGFEPQLADQVASCQKRQALVMYFQFNQAGITIFGWAVDRTLMGTIFFIELSLVLWVLGRTIVGSSK